MMFPDTVGGVVHLQYSQLGTAGRSIHLAVAPFADAPSGPNNDYAYTGAGVAPTESGVLATVAALGALWAPYYDSTWSLSLAGVWRNVGGLPQLVPVTPTAVPVAGTYTAPETLEGIVKRTLSLYTSKLSRRWRLWLRQVPGTTVGEDMSVSSTVGGIDARDRAWYAYLASSAAGVVGRDGSRFQNWGKVRQWWDTTFAAEGPYVVSG